MLHLVRERELDIATVPLASVALQYFAYVSAARDVLDVERVAEYLVMAATLVFLKSKSLLPPIPAGLVPAGEDGAEEVEERLRLRLIAYSQYRTVADDLRARALQAESFYYRDAGPGATGAASGSDGESEPGFVQRYAIAPVKLGAALLAALRQAKPERRRVVRERFTIARQMDFVAEAVRASGRVEFRDLCQDLTRAAIIATFLAILELIRSGRIAYAQPAFGEQLFLFPPESLAEPHAT